MDGTVLASNKFVIWSIGFAMLMSLLAAITMTNFVAPSLFNDLAVFREHSATGTTQESTLAISSPVTPSYRALGGIIYSFTSLTGWQSGGILVLKLLLCFGIGITCHGYSVRNQVSFSTFSFFGFLALVASTCFGVTQLDGSLFSAVLMVALLDCLNRDLRLGGFWIWGTIPILAVWNCLHPSVVIGLVTLLAYAIGRGLEALEQNKTEALSRLYLLVVAGFGIATLALNPHGWQIVSIFFSSLGETSILARESSHIWHGNMTGQLLLVMLIGIASLGFCLARPWPIFESLALAFTSTIAIIDIQYMSMFLVAWLCLIPPMVEKSNLGELWRHWFLSKQIQVALSSLIIGCVSLGVATHNQFWQLQFPTQVASNFNNAPIYPIDAVDFLNESKFHGNILVPAEFTGYMYWRLHAPKPEPLTAEALSSVTLPNGTVPNGTLPNESLATKAISTNFHSTMSLADNRHFYLGSENWRELLESQSPIAFLVPKSAPLYQQLNQEKKCLNGLRWKPVYEDLNYAILAKEEKASVASLPSPQLPSR